MNKKGIIFAWAVFCSVVIFCLGYASPVLLSLFILLKNHKKHPFLLLINVLCAIFVLFPIFGKIWNGFSYVSQRWSFVIALPIAKPFIDKSDRELSSS